jgi:hypothetical protein
MRQRAFKVKLARYRSEILMCAFVAEIIASPLADSHRYFGGFLAVLLLMQLLLASTYMASRRIVKLVVLPVAGVWLLARLVEAFSDPRHFYAHLAPIAGFLLSCATLWAIFDRFDWIERINRSVISEAFICYLVIAIAFSQLFWGFSRLIPHCFNQEIPTGQSGTFLYFSMITLSGVGYGGIIPINPYVRLIAALENMIGIFYIAVVVARLVSSYRAKSHHKETESRSETSRMA